MASTYYSIATNYGEAAAANAFLTGTKVNITTFVVGDGGGQYYEPSPDMTELRNQVWSGVITNAEIDAGSPNMIHYTTLIPSNVGGFTMREMGILDEAGKLVGVCNMPDTPKVRFEDGVTSEDELIFTLVLASPGGVEWVVDPTVIIATKRDIQNHNEASDAHGDIRGLISGLHTVARTGSYTDLANVPSTFTPAAHNHSATEITSGTLPIARGGTGGTTAAAALTNLGAYSKAEVDAALAKKANTNEPIQELEIPEKHSLILPGQGGFYFKDQFGMVHIRVFINYEDGTTIPSSGLLVGVLPDGYRPRADVERVSLPMRSRLNGVISGDLTVRNTGRVEIALPDPLPSSITGISSAITSMIFLAE